MNIADRLAIPVVVAPMFLVSTPEMALAACREGLLGSFPSVCARSEEELESWLRRMDAGLKVMVDAGAQPAPFGVNLTVDEVNPRLRGDLALCVKHKVPVVLTSKGVPHEVTKAVHSYGGIVLHDVASRRHAEKALSAGVDGLIAVAAGAGGHTGSLSPFALLNEVRQIYDGPLGLGGGITTGRDVLAAQAMGADFAYMGTRFIATEESGAPHAHKQLILDSRGTDIFLTSAISGAPANWLSGSLPEGVGPKDMIAAATAPMIAGYEKPNRWKDVWSAGHGVGNIHDIPSVAALCERLKTEYETARQLALCRLEGSPRCMPEGRR